VELTGAEVVDALVTKSEEALSSDGPKPEASFDGFGTVVPDAKSLGNSVVVPERVLQVLGGLLGRFGLLGVGKAFPEVLDAGDFEANL